MITVPAHEKKQYVNTTCDRCGKDVDINEKSFNTVEVEISCRAGDCWPEGGSQNVYSTDCCYDCFHNEVMPALKSLGFKFNIEDRSY